MRRWGWGIYWLVFCCVWWWSWETWRSRWLRRDLWGFWVMSRNWRRYYWTFWLVDFVNFYRFCLKLFVWGSYRGRVVLIDWVFVDNFRGCSRCGCRGRGYRRFRIVVFLIGFIGWCIWSFIFLVCFIIGCRGCFRFFFGCFRSSPFLLAFCRVFNVVRLFFGCTGLLVRLAWSCQKSRRRSSRGCWWNGKFIGLKSVGFIF